MKKLESEYGKAHKQIIKTIERFMQETDANAIIVTELAKELKIDTRTLNKHLEILEMGEWGHFNESRHLFVRKDKI
jgi:DNA-binding MarR family transcriptional regulator